MPLKENTHCQSSWEEDCLGAEIEDSRRGPGNDAEVSLYLSVSVSLLLLSLF